MSNLIVIMLLLTVVGMLMFKERPTLGYTVDQNAQLAAAYKNKADAFESLNAALKRQVTAQEDLLNAYREKYGIPQ